MHVIKGEYENAVFPRWGATTSYTDPLFTLKVKENTLYEFSFWIYIEEEPQYPINWLQFFYDYSASNGYILLNNTPDIGKWKQYTARFVTKAGQDKISLCFNASEKPNNMWIDEFRIKEIYPGTLSPFKEGGYCEDMHNILADNEAFKDIKAAKSGVYKIDVANSTQYTFGIDFNSSKKSNSRVFLSYDGINPIMPSDDVAVPANIAAEAQNRRYSIEFVTKTTGYIYLVIENNDNSFSLSEPMMFKSYAASSGNLLESEEPIDRKLSVNKKIKELIKLSTNELSIENNSYDESPATGDSSAPLLILIITFVVSAGLLALTKKGGEQA